MSRAGPFHIERMTLTAGEIAAINLRSARERAWARFWRSPAHPDIAELILEQEQLTAQFVGDLTAFERLETLVDEFARVEPHSARAALIAGRVACSTHRFDEARAFVAQALARDAAPDSVDDLMLSIDQATGRDLPAILAARRERATLPGRWEERVSLGALLADMGEFDEAERTYIEALRAYPHVSPFAPACVCFQLGVLWGERVPEPHVDRATEWYRCAIDVLPCYVKARVHLAELCLARRRIAEARALLEPVAESGDPEVAWRLADVAEAAGDDADASKYLTTARSGFESLLAKHPLAFADHCAEFYAGSGRDAARAYGLARLNLENRPTLRAFEQAHSTALAADELRAAEELVARAQFHWGSTAAFSGTQLAVTRTADEAAVSSARV